MGVTNLNLEDRRSWLKFQHILTSFVSDYIDLVAPEQIDLRLQSHTLTIAFNFVNDRPEGDYVNRFTRQLEQWLNRLRLVGVRRIELEFYAPDADSPSLVTAIEVQFIPASAIQSSANDQTVKQARTPRRGGLVRRLRGWLVSPENIENLQTSGRLAVRDPKGFLTSARNLVVGNLTRAIDWVDTFPWEEKFQSSVQAQKRRHQRNLGKAIFEDAVIVLVMVLALWWVFDYFSGPTLDVSAMPAQHYDSSMDAPRYRCAGHGIKLENYICLQRGMSYEQVAGILGSEGKPMGIDYQFGGSINQSREIQEKLKRGEAIDYRKQPVIMSWQSNNMVINATFKDNELVARGYRKL
jgi:hypothetical protein